MATQLEIINKALGHISIAPITSVSESSPAAILANSIWDTCRQDCLRNHDWPFATIITTLSTTNSTIVHNDWVYAYAYPTDALEVWNVYYNDTDNRQHFRVIYDKSLAAKVILSNTAEAAVEYTYDQTITSPWDAYFVSVIAYFLAANMAKPLTGNSELADSMMKIYSSMMSDAERMSSYETDIGTELSQRSAFVDVREGSSMGTEDHYVAVRHPNG
jgi:hypothetical protein